MNSIKMYRVLLALLAITATNGGKPNGSRLLPTNRIVNGVPAGQGEFPSQVSLQSDGSHSCGASILNEYWAVTACHCVEGFVPDNFTLYAGSVDLEEGGIVHQVVEIIQHEEYSPATSYTNDIALLRVETPFEIDGVSEKPIPLPNQGDNPAEGSPATTIGWGYNASHLIPPHLQKVEIAIFNQEECNEIYIEDMDSPVYDSQICADTLETGTHGPCRGDSGGPLLVDGTVVGLVSWAHDGCATPGYPIVFTRVSAFRDWIKGKTGL